jgi:polyisoprenoid-binding protein YceI
MPVGVLALGVLVCGIFADSFGMIPQAAGQRSAVAGTQPPAEGADEVSLELSRVYIFVGKTGLGHEHGIEGRLRSGWIRLGAAENAGEFVFDMPSFDADTNAARRYLGLAGSTDASTRRQVNDNMKGAGVLDVRRFPTATFRIRSALPAAQQSAATASRYSLDGDFTLHGVTHPLQIPVESAEDEHGTRLKGSFAILQTAYGITPFRKAFGAVGVTNQLRIHGDVRLAKAAAGGALTGK